MKNHRTTTRTQPPAPRLARHQARQNPPATPKPGETRDATPRRLYTDFLALAFYPGMHRPGPAQAA